jgi:hypothetical protein
MASRSKDYKVGYGRPPKASQFKKGQPRPPRRGTPKLDLAKCIEEELHSIMQFTDERGQHLKLPKMKVLAKQLVNTSIKKGDVRRLEGLLPKAEVQSQEQFSEADLAMIARFIAKLMPEGGTP